METESGYIKLYRSVVQKGYWKDSEYVHLWIYLLMKASYQEKEYLFNNKVHTLKPGQFITGRNTIVRETRINRSKIERILKCFESEQQIEQQTTNKFRVITICNWSKYQCNGQPESSKRATSEQPVSTINKDKKEKKIKEVLLLPKMKFNHGTQSWENITQEDRDGWKSAYPACNIDVELAKMKEWILSNPSKGHKSNWRSFITGWLNRAQDKGGSGYSKRDDFDDLLEVTR